MNLGKQLEMWITILIEKHQSIATNIPRDCWTCIESFDLGKETTTGNASVRCFRHHVMLLSLILFLTNLDTNDTSTGHTSFGGHC